MAKKSYHLLPQKTFFSFLASLEDANHRTLTCGGLIKFDAHTNGCLGGRTTGRAQGVQSVRLPFGWVQLLPASCAAWLGWEASCAHTASCGHAAQLCPRPRVVDG